MAVQRILNIGNCCYGAIRPLELNVSGCSAVVARFVRGEEAGGSNPLTPTKIFAQEWTCNKIDLLERGCRRLDQKSSENNIDFDVFY